jgi:hypothetical protein
VDGGRTGECMPVGAENMRSLILAKVEPTVSADCLAIDCGVFGFDEIEIELGLAVEILGLGEFGVGAALLLGGLEFADQFDHGVHRQVAQLVNALLVQLDALLHFLFGPVVARLAGAVDV